MDIEKYTFTVQESLAAAQQLAIQRNNPEINIVHVWKALMERPDSLLMTIYERTGINKKAFSDFMNTELAKIPEISGSTSTGQYISSGLQQLLAKADKEASALSDQFISVEHLILALMELKSNPITEFVHKQNISKKDLLKQINLIRGNQKVETQNPEATYETLKKYGRDLVAAVKEGKIDPVIGRDTEIRNVIRILSRKTKNNPVLIGEPGVGKTAIVEGLAQRIVRQGCS